MPEGDSILQLSQRLQFLVGKQVTRTSIRTPRFATQDFTGACCQKNLAIRKIPVHAF